VPDTKPSLAKLFVSLAFAVSYPALLLFLSGDWGWPEGWIFSVWFTVLCSTIFIYLYRRDPALLAERYKRFGAANQRGWDLYLFPALLVAFIAWVVVMPLDAKRYGWSGQLPLLLKVLGGLALPVSSFFMFRSFTDNTFLSPLVRIQSERRQHVVSSGVYGVLRHPMYLGIVLMYLGTPLLLGSLWGLGIGAAMSLVLAARNVGEEKMLTEELEGYAEYKRRVRFRLIPFVW
jgi:protein-S-isoprenylcysteine O-methyltransferase Ste14